MNRRTKVIARAGVAGALLAGAVGFVATRDASAATSTFTPVADTYVQSTSASTNFGTSGQLDVDNSPVRRTFLRFTVTGSVARSPTPSCASTSTTSPTVAAPRAGPCGA